MMPYFVVVLQLRLVLVKQAVLQVFCLNTTVLEILVDLTGS